MERLGQAFLSTDQPDNRQRIPVTLLGSSCVGGLGIAARYWVRDLAALGR
jgi:hypothetical protein